MIQCCIHTYYTIIHSHYKFFFPQPKLVTHFSLVLTLHQSTRHGVRMGVETVKSFNHYSERIQLSMESRKLPANINDKDRQQQQSLTTKTEPHQHLLKRLPTWESGHKIQGICWSIQQGFWLVVKPRWRQPTYIQGGFFTGLPLKMTKCQIA